jgi:phosphate uptake regulator
MSIQSAVTGSVDLLRLGGSASAILGRAIEAFTDGDSQLVHISSRKHIERIGDYIKDVCELTVYTAEAEFIKHVRGEDVIPGSAE